MPTRQFTCAELNDLGVPPADPSDVRYSETLLADTHVTTLKYSQQRRVVFRADDDGKTYAVTYEAEVDSGDYEGGPPPENHGWFGGTVEAEEVEQRPVVIQQWVTVSDEPGLHGPRQSLLDELTDMFEEGGVRTSIARQSAAEWMTDHTDEMAALSRARHFLEAAAAITALQNQMDAEIRAEYGGELDRDTEVESTATRRMAAMLRERSDEPAPKPAAEDPTPRAAASTAPAPLVDEPRPFEELRDTGLLWLVNRLAFHPRGVALAVHTDDAGTAHGWSLLRSSGGPMAFDTATDAEGQARAETTLAAAADTPR